MSDGGLRGYDLSAILAPGGHASWSKKEAREYFARFMREIDARLDTLQTAITDSGYGCLLDFTRGSLECIGRFLKDHVRTRLLRPDERTAQREALAHEIPTEAVDAVLGIAGGWTLDEVTTSLCVDVGMYFGEVMRRTHPALEWSLWSRRTIELNKPVLTGFVRGVPLDPEGIIEVFAMGLAEGTHNESRLTELFDIWSSRVNETQSASKQA